MSNASNIEHALLIDSNADTIMQPFLENRSFAMLPVGGKPLVQFWCEHLNLVGIKKCHLVMRRFPEQVRQFVGQGERWGLEISVSTIPEQADADETLKLILAYLSANTLVSSFNQLPETGLQNWLNAATSTTSNVTAMEAQDQLHRLTAITPDGLRQLLAGNETAIAAGSEVLLRTIEQPKDLWQANMDWLAGNIEDPLPAGFTGEEGLVTEMGVQIKPGFTFTAPCSLGKHSLIESQANIGPNVVIGSHCIVDKSCRIKESVILDHTYIGSHSDLNRVIADGRLIYQVDLELPTWIDDPSIIGSTRVINRSVSLGDRFLALLLLLVVSPVLLILILTRWVKRLPVFVKENIYIPSGRDLTGEVALRTLMVHSLDTGHPYWRHVPWLYQVVNGELELVGVTPAMQPDREVPEWARELMSERPGVITLFDLSRDENSIDDSCFVTDNYYLATRSFKNNILLIGRWIAKLVNFTS